MASMGTALGSWRGSWIKRRVPKGEREAATPYSLEEAAELAPGWGAVEVRGPQGKRAGNTTPDWRWEVDRLRLGR